MLALPNLKLESQRSQLPARQPWGAALDSSTSCTVSRSGITDLRIILQDPPDRDCMYRMKLKADFVKIAWYCPRVVEMAPCIDETPQVAIVNIQFEAVTDVVTLAEYRWNLPLGTFAMAKAPSRSVSVVCEKPR